MRFHLIDRITEWTPRQSLRAVKNLTLGEEYLADHFPGFPVMPGVLMLQTLVECGAWLLRLSEDYAHSVIVLREVKNIKYGSFMEPGKQLLLHIEWVDRQDRLAIFKGKGEADGVSCVTARIVLATYNLGEATRDQAILDDLKQQARLLCELPGGVAASTTAGA
jgi:3-hydroxyacyl-[acyl-carrier-protein] dehydratase